MTKRLFGFFATITSFLFFSAYALAAHRDRPVPLSVPNQISLGEGKAFSLHNRPLSIRHNEAQPNILCVIDKSLGEDQDGEEIDEVNITFTIGADREGTVIQIDWGSGKQDYTIGSKEPSSITQTVDAGARIKVYGDITHFDASGNKVITDLVLGANPRLMVLRLSQNKVSALDLSALPALRELMLTDNRLSSVDLTKLHKLEEFYGGWNQYAALDTHDNPELKVLTCYNTQISTLDISHNTKLEVLTAGGNKYKEPVSLAKNINLRALDLESSGISSVDISKLTKLTKLVIGANNLTALDMRNNPLLREIDIRRNKMDACAINDILFILSQCDAEKAEIKINGNPGAATSDAKLVEKSKCKIDVSGDGKGCETARLLFAETSNGSFSTRVDGSELPQWTPVSKGRQVDICATPEPNYILDKLMINGKVIAGTRFELQNYGILSAIFVSTQAICPPKCTDAINISQSQTSVLVRGIAPQATYEVYNMDGSRIAYGQTSDTGDANVTIPRGIGAIIFRQGAVLIKTIR